MNTIENSLHKNKLNIKEDKNSRHRCNPNNQYNKICIPDPNGYYKSEQSCINDCENKYINNHLLKAKIKGETMKFYLFIKDIINNENIDIYLKGGNVIGLYILKLIYNKYKHNDAKFEDAFNKFLDLNLIKDWDFAGYVKNDEIDKLYRQKMDKIAANYKLVPRAKTFILYQTRIPILLNNQALFEIAILEPDKYSKLEIPMTTMKIKVNEYNLKYIFMFAKTFLTSEFDFDIIKKMIKNIYVTIHPHKKGFYEPKNKIDEGDLSDDFIRFINNFTNNNDLTTQFLITHIQDPYRMLYRLPIKNMPKTDKIKSYINDVLHKDKPTWLIDTCDTMEIAERFSKKLGEKLSSIYDHHLTKVVKFLDGINFNRIMSDYNNLPDKSINLLKLWFGPLISEIKKNGIDDNIEETRTIKFIKFLMDHQLLNHTEGGYYNKYLKYRAKYINLKRFQT